MIRKQQLQNTSDLLTTTYFTLNSKYLTANCSVSSFVRHLFRIDIHANSFQLIVDVLSCGSVLLRRYCLTLYGGGAVSSRGSAGS